MLVSLLKKVLFGFVVSYSTLLFIATPVWAADSTTSSLSDESNLYTLMPMFLPEAPLSLSYDNLLLAMAEDQGYEAHCSGAQWKITQAMWGAIAKFFSSSYPPLESFYNGLNPTIFGGSQAYIVDLTKAHTPLLRGSEDKSTTMKNSSFEGLFGANYQIVNNLYMLNAAGASERLLTAYQQCMVKVQNLNSINTICAEITGEECSLNKEYTINTGSKSLTFKTLEILEWFQELYPDLGGNTLYNQVCTDVASGGTSSDTTLSTGVDQSLLSDIKAAVNTIPIDLDSLYRLAFLVLAPTQDKKENDTFYFLQSNPQVNEKVEAPIIIAFKIPDFGTNKSKIANNLDTLEISKMVIQAQAQNELDLKTQQSKRDDVYVAAKNAQSIKDPVIDCPDSYPQCTRSTENALLNVILDIINGTAPDCTNTTLRVLEDTTIESIFDQEDQNWEVAGDLFTPANKDIKENLYKGNTNQLVADRLSGSSSDAFDWQVTIDQDPPDLGEPVTVNAYLVLPVGESIKDANKALSIFWNEESFFDLVRTNVIADMQNADGSYGKVGAIPKYYTIKGANVGFSASDSISPLDERKEITRTTESGAKITEYVYTNYTVGVSLTEDKDAPLFPDFGLGFMLRKIQQTIRSTFDQSYRYIASCERVEDMFLGRCSGILEGEATGALCSGEAFANIKNLPSADGIPQQAQDIYSTAILPDMTEELVEAYEYAEQETGIPCEVVAGIHWTEGGLNPEQSVFDGGALRNGSLKEDAKAAMEHLISKWPSTFDKNNIEYEDLAKAIGAYNGEGNLNCAKETRWLNGGKCPAKFSYEDHPHPLAWIDERHSDMDLVFCLDYVEFNCSSNPDAAALAELRSSLDEKQAMYNFTDAKKEALISTATTSCYANSDICQSLSSDNSRYPKYTRPGSITTAILLNASEGG